ncbi:MAG: isoleucine--tRNA ligase [Planctomycetaceae bacterium]|nr:isoleucine--tRNA ligase [Planctomycetaceae bacterium]
MSEQKNAYKDTLNLPQTAFDMRAGLLQKEPAVQAKWKQENLQGKIRDARRGAQRFILHDGPPYANGQPHMGHVLNKVLKDLVVRIKTMSGLDTGPYIHGWDCHGQPIEQKIVEQLGEKIHTLPATVIRRLCGEHAQKYAKIQAEQFQRLGVMGDFDHPYITMDKQYEAAVLEVFANLIEQGLVYRQLKPVHWSIENRTALADAELEYHDRTDPSVYVALPVVSGTLPNVTGQACLLVWTTTPWTLPANLAVAAGPAIGYACVACETSDGPLTLVMARARVETVLAAVKAARPEYLRSHKIVATLSGDELLSAALTYRHPLLEGKTCPVISADYVTLEDGTGLVHTAPGHGLEDYASGLKHGLEIYCPVQADGTFDETAPEFIRGRSVWDANGLICERLKADGALVLQEPIRHSYPHDWRSKTPTIFRATEQWFIGVDTMPAGGNTSLRQMALDVCTRDADDGGVRFIPAWGRNRIEGMLASRPDWCISRQRSWGLPIPAFMNQRGEVLMTADSVRAVAAVVAREGSDAWFTRTPAELLAGYSIDSDDYAPASDVFPIDSLQKGGDIFDVWFESGSSWFAAAIQRGLVSDIPVDLYLEGSDQHRGWFQLSLLPALGTRGKAPFKTVLTHGFVVTEDGYKMSKSLGNAVDAVEQLNKRGADVLRLWVASQNYQDDIRCSESLILQSDEAYKKIRNTLRFCMGSCFDFAPAADATEAADHSVDRWMSLELNRLVRDVRAAFDAYEFHRATRMIYEFCTVQASSVYLSAVKDRLYCESPNALRRRATQTVIHRMLMALVKLLAPIMPHTAEEAWAAIPNRPADEPQSVHLALLPEADADMLAIADEMRPSNIDLGTFTSDQLQPGPQWIWDRLMDLRGEGLGKLEKLRGEGVKNSLDAEAVFRVAKGRDGAADLIDTYIRELEDLLGVGFARVERAELAEGVTVEVEVLDTRERYDRCARSWKRRPDVGSDSDYPDLSARDAGVMKELKSGTTE